MIKIILYMSMLLLCLNTTSQAAKGDTTWVQATISDMDYIGNFDSAVVFPAKGKTFSKIYMIFTLGKHACSGSVCGDWDYTIQTFLMQGGQSLELGRFISPYANMSGPRTPASWKKDYVYDVTDYAPLLHDSATIRIFYSGYTGGFTGNVRFAFIEGGPDREVMAVRKLWSGGFGYGGPVSINTNFPTIHETAPAFTESAALKFTVSGHGSDANGCCEFAAHNYQVVLEGRTIADKTIWRDKCGENQIFPQTGTWPINRANWCPGEIVYPDFHRLPGVVAGASYNLGLQFDPYSGGGMYITETHLFYYGGMKKVLDASIDDIISPSNSDDHYRQNPICGSPVIHVKNRGKEAIDSITFKYGVSDTIMQTWTWKGKLASLEEKDITLDVVKKLNTLSQDSATGLYKFSVSILTVNGKLDADETNNKMNSQFLVAPRWPASFRIIFTPNNEAPASKPTISETSWYIYDMNNNIVKKRADVPVNPPTGGTKYTDTISLPKGQYRLQVYDSSCDGLNWWFHETAGDGIKPGSFFVRKLMSEVVIPVNGYVTSGTFAHDFGCGITQYFSVDGPDVPNTVENVNETLLELLAYPNPAQSMVSIDIAGIEQVKGSLKIIDALGRVVIAAECRDTHNEINTSALTSGIYNVIFVNETTGNKLTTRLLIAK